ncbi:hypothetical protein ECC49_06670 [Helicobacter pylori]|uniref:hypothetical protein n=2 Tax=Helicobacter pylori TaxID=210 RepID=UPI000FDD9820|nr:hypothetical protein [Helicobacter pylori]RVY75036.1 hypothetical protein ECC49_06670 [Helicobacter pylori]
MKNKSYRFTETSFYKTIASIKQQLYTPKTKFQGIMFSKSFYHFLFSWQTPIKNYPHNCTYGGVYFTTIFLKPNPNQLKTLLKA